MLMKELVEEISTAISKLPKNYESDFFIQQESDLTVYELKQLLKKYDLFHIEPANLLEKVNSASAAPFLEFLKTRWLRIKNTDAVYPHHHKSPANLICVELARQLAGLLEMKPAKFIMPDLEVTEIPVAAGLPEDVSLHLHRIVLSDDNKNVIDVGKAATLEKLSETEKSRVIHHSDHSKAVNEKILDEKEGWKGGVRKNNKRLRAHLNKANVPESRSTYGETGRLLLQANLSNSLKAMVLSDNQTFSTAISDQALYIGDEAHAKSAFLPFIMHYRTELAIRPDDYSGKLGWISGYNKTDKLKTADFIYKFFLSDKPLSELKPLIDLPENLTHKKILTQYFSVSKVIYDQALKIADPAYRALAISQHAVAKK